MVRIMVKEKIRGNKGKIKRKSNKGAVSLKTPIGELVMKYPKAAGVLMHYGFHCIGCQMAAYETLGEGAAAHGMDKKKAEKLVKEINKAIKGK